MFALAETGFHLWESALRRGSVDDGVVGVVSSGGTGGGGTLGSAGLSKTP